MSSNAFSNNDLDENEEIFDPPPKPRKQRNHRAAEKYFSDDGVSTAKKNAFKKRRDELR